jgi:hypothetical protein
VAPVQPAAKRHGQPKLGPARGAGEEMGFERLDVSPGALTPSPATAGARPSRSGALLP